MQDILWKVEQFLQRPSVLPKVIIIYGPTACGKTGLSIQIASSIHAEIIGADSRQIYRGMNIGTGKVTQEEMKGIPHHMIDIRNPPEKYSVAVYQKEVFSLISEIHSKKKIPIICGGTGLYLDSVAFHFDMPEMEPDWEYRNHLEEIRLEKGNLHLWNMLNLVDPAYAQTIHPNSHHAVIRALEVFEKTGKSKQFFRVQKDPRYDILFLTPYDGDRKVLYERINRRIDEMFDAGLVSEVEQLLSL